MPKTPSLSQLNTLIVAAQSADLAVTLRPLLNETSLGEARPHWAPLDVAAWLSDYRQFLLPYAALAQRDHIAVFAIGTEFTRFSTAPEWNELAVAVRAVYHGGLSYSNNWVGHPNKSLGVTQTFDAYQPLNLPTTAPEAALETGWAAWLHRLPAGSVLSEVGIAAQTGAYMKPWERGSPTAPINSQIQVNWFTAACQAVGADHLEGIYFWPLYFGQSLTTPMGASGPTSFAATSGAAAITKCFATLGRTS